MIALQSDVRVYLACGYTDMRNYVVPIVMWRRPRGRSISCGRSFHTTPHNFERACLI
jgi:hypothetical protein